MRIIPKALAFLVAMAAYPARAQPNAPDWPTAIPPGTWRITGASHLLGPPQYPGTMNDLPPNQRAYLQSLIGQEGTPRTDELCLNPARLHRGIVLGLQQPMRCTRDLRQPTATRVEITLICNAVQSRTRFHAELAIPAPGTFTGRYEIDRTGGTGPIRIAAEVSGQFLRPSCPP